MSHLHGLPASRCPGNGSLSNSIAELYLRRIDHVDAVREQLEGAVRLTASLADLSRHFRLTSVSGGKADSREEFSIIEISRREPLDVV